MAADHQFATIDFTDTFLLSLGARDFTPADRRKFVKALRLLEEDPRHPSLGVHALHGDQEGSWSAAASASLRMTFERLGGGRKRMLTCGKHYDR